MFVNAERVTKIEIVDTDGHPDRGWRTAKNMNLEAFYVRQKDDQGVLLHETLTVCGLVAVASTLGMNTAGTGWPRSLSETWLPFHKVDAGISPYVHNVFRA